MNSLHKKGDWNRRIIRSGYWQLYLLLLIPLLFLIVFKYIPMGGISIAFFDYNIFGGLAESEFVGLKHFKDLFSDPMFIRAFKNTLFINVYKLAFWIPLPLMLAVMFNELRVGPYRKIVQTVANFPHFLSWVIVGGIFLRLLSVNDGAINEIIKLFGGDPVKFMYSKSLFPSVLVWSSMWKEIGFGTVVYMGVIVSIDPALYEAAMMDGASKWRQTLHITLPNLVGTMMVLLVTNLGSLLTNSFEQILVMYNEAVFDVADVISTYVYRIGIGGMEYSYSTAVNVFNGVIGFILVMGSNATCRKFFNRSLW